MCKKSEKTDRDTTVIDGMMVCCNRHCRKFKDSMGNRGTCGFPPPLAPPGCTPCSSESVRTCAPSGAAVQTAVQIFVAAGMQTRLHFPSVPVAFCLLLFVQPPQLGCPKKTMPCDSCSALRNPIRVIRPLRGRYYVLICAVRISLAGTHNVRRGRTD